MRRTRVDKSVRAARERGKRAERLNNRLFNNPLAVFVEHKYPLIFEEYNELYRKMKETHPARKNLVTSVTFQEWLAENTAVAASPAAPSSPAATSPPSPPAPSPVQVPDILTQAVEETGVGIVQPLQGPQDIRQEIDEIINEMLRDEDLHDILEAPLPEDEGIELNLEDEIYHDIQPFDFELEVEPYEY